MQCQNKKQPIFSFNGISFRFVFVNCLAFFWAYAQTNLIDLYVWLHNLAHFFFRSCVLCVAKIQLQLNSIAFYIMWLLHNSFYITSEKREKMRKKNSSKSRITRIPCLSYWPELIPFRWMENLGQSKLPPKKSTNTVALIPHYVVC